MLSELTRRGRGDMGWRLGRATRQKRSSACRDRNLPDSSAGAGLVVRSAWPGGGRFAAFADHAIPAGSAVGVCRLVPAVSRLAIYAPAVRATLTGLAGAWHHSPEGQSPRAVRHGRQHDLCDCLRHGAVVGDHGHGGCDRFWRRFHSRLPQPAPKQRPEPVGLPSQIGTVLQIGMLR
jgi:hypothetical protein